LKVFVVPSRARWSESLKAWLVPDRTAEKRIGRWLAEMEAQADAFADDKGRDAFAFEPIESHDLRLAGWPGIGSSSSSRISKSFKQAPISIEGFAVGCGPPRNDATRSSNS
jgi:hypothetical protein